MDPAPETDMEAEQIDEDRSWLGLVVLQPSPFCNINCDYCYLPSRTDTRRMSMETLEKTVQEIFASDLVSGGVTFVWHAGEPLAVPISWYEEAFEVVARSTPAEMHVSHSFQSNGLLLNDRWCEFIKAREIHIGLSIDGPARIHDAHRKTRQGAGTHAGVMRGAELLRSHGIDFHVIAVVSRESLDCADEIFDFFVENGIFGFGFNIEETEGVHLHSTLEETTEDRIAAFFRRIFARQKAENGRVRVREFENAAQRILSTTKEEEFVYDNEQVRPFGMLNVDWQGNFSTYSPELLGLTLKEYGEFSFGNISQTHFQDATEDAKFQRVLSDIQTGVEKCRAECAYFGVCAGGAPANKYFENGSFATTETRYCRYAIQVPTQLVLQDLEEAVRDTAEG